MKTLSYSSAVAALVALTSPMFAQSPQSQPQNQTTGIGTSPQVLTGMPDNCRQAVQSNQQGQMMMNMPMMQGTMQPGQNMPMGANLSQANQDYMEAMQKMNPPMMMGMMISNPDLAFLCSMIAHHQGAIDMAEAVQKHGKDSEVKKQAEKTIREQKKDIQELTELVKNHGK